MATPNQEDYLEAIWQITAAKGYVRVIDIAQSLKISQASVSKMIRRLKEDDLLEVEKYRGLSLTPKGSQQGQKLVLRHRTLEQFLTALGISDATIIWHDVEGIEHHFSAETLTRLKALVQFIGDHPQWWKKFLDTQEPSPPTPASNQTYHI